MTTNDFGLNESIGEQKPIRCPVCKSENIADHSTYQNNGVVGYGYKVFKTSDIRVCNDCGVMFKPVKGNGL
jgi:predicted Zn-ribbon and HTH transcriptional regulator